MLAFISFLLVCIGSFNWFTIGILQYDFVAGLFGSQANVFSRLVYALVGVASIVVIFNLIKNKGKFVISFKKASDEFKEFKEEQEEKKEEKKEDMSLATSSESSKEFWTVKPNEESKTPHENTKKENDNLDGE